MAHKGERVILSSRAGYAELTPISEEDKKFDDYVQSEQFQKYAAKVVQEYKEGKAVVLRTPEEIEAYLNSL